MAKRSIRNYEIDGKTVLLRVDYNLPMRPGTTEILDDRRILATVPTLAHLLERSCRILIVTHLGRPDGRWVEELALAPVSDRRGYWECPYCNFLATGARRSRRQSK